MSKSKEKIEYIFPKVGDQLYLEPREGKQTLKAGFYRLVKCSGYYSLVSEETWEATWRYDDIAEMMEEYLKDSRIFRLEK